MRIDIRLPMGVMFTIMGLILGIFGLVSNPAIYKKSLGINVNLWWGLALLIFGLAMLGLTYRAARRAKDAGDHEEVEQTPAAAEQTSSTAQGRVG